MTTTHRPPRETPSPEPAPPESSPGEPPEAAAPPHDPYPETPEPILSPGVRIGLHILGWLLVLIGTAGLVLPGIQGIVTILAGVVVLSLVSLTVHRWARRGLARWPNTLERYERMREKATRRFGKNADDGGKAPSGPEDSEPTAQDEGPDDAGRRRG